ncbi:glycosyltransferase [Microbacterium sp. NPDC058342]|uniref:glycosyltransferase n=1 Tax=Microbacterium sp. NPDC058342 TaxID=3346454 RepID=UPI003666FFF9
MRVATVKGSLLIPPTYFAVQHPLLLADRVNSRIFTGAAEIAPSVDLGGIQVVDTTAQLRPFGGLPVRQRERLSLLMAGRTARAVTAWRPDIIHQHVAYSSRAAVIAARSGTPLVVTVHGGDAFAPLREGRGLGVTARASLARMKRDIRGAFARADRILAVSDYLAEVAVLAGAPADRVHVHRQGVDIDAFAPALRMPRSTPRVLFVGALTETKGARDLLQAADGLDAEIRFAGAGPLEGELRTRAETDRRLTILGRVAREAVVAEMQQADVLVLPTRVNRGAREAAGLVLLEAQAVGTPVIAYDSGGTSEMIDEGRSGLLAPEGDIGALGERLRHVLALGVEERSAMRERARAFVVAERSAQQAAEQLFETYQDLLR